MTFHPTHKTSLFHGICVCRIKYGTVIFYTKEGIIPMAKKKFHLINELHEQIMKIATMTKNGQVRINRTELKQTIENTFTAAAKTAASGERVRFPVIGAIVRKEVAARKAGKGINPFTKEEIMVKARPASKKPRWSFPRTLKDTFANKRNW